MQTEPLQHNWVNYTYHEKKEKKNYNEWLFFVTLTRVSVDSEKRFPFKHAVNHPCTAAVCGVVSVWRGNLHNGCACWR